MEATKNSLLLKLTIKKTNIKFGYQFPCCSPGVPARPGRVPSQILPQESHTCPVREVGAEADGFWRSITGHKWRKVGPRCWGIQLRASHLLGKNWAQIPKSENLHEMDVWEFRSQDQTALQGHVHSPGHKESPQKKRSQLKTSS